jgi:hypothetical protein
MLQNCTMKKTQLEIFLHKKNVNKNKHNLRLKKNMNMKFKKIRVWIVFKVL